MVCFYCTQTHIKLQSEFSREFLKTIFARLPPLANAARCGPHPPHPLRYASAANLLAILYTHLAYTDRKRSTVGTFHYATTATWQTTWQCTYFTTRNLLAQEWCINDNRSTYLCWLRGTARICPPLLQQSIGIISCPPVWQQQTCCSGFAALGSCWDRQTDRRTDTVPFRRTCFAHYAGSVDNQSNYSCYHDTYQKV